MPRNWVVLLALVLPLSQAGCGETPAPPPATAPSVAQKTPTRLTIAAASDLQGVFKKLAARFVELNPEINLDTSFDSSGNLSEKIKAGGPFDVFLSADMGYVKKLAEAGTIDPASVRPYAVGSLTLGVNKTAGEGIRSLKDLLKPEVKHVAIANPRTAPYGAAAKQALTRAGLWEQLEPKLAIAGTVRQALQYVETGNAEAGLLSKASADVESIRLVDVDPSLYDPIVQGLGVIASTSHKVETDRFVAFLLSENGQAELTKFGFRPPPRP